MSTPLPSLTRWLSVLLLLFILPLSALATQIYKHTDAQGNVTYSDQPPAPFSGSMVRASVLPTSR